MDGVVRPVYDLMLGNVLGTRSVQRLSPGVAKEKERQRKEAGRVADMDKITNRSTYGWF